MKIKKKMEIILTKQIRMFCRFRNSTFTIEGAKNLHTEHLNQIIIKNISNSLFYVFFEMKNWLNK